MASTAILGQGCIVQIGTGSGGAKTITAAAIGNPTIFTSAAHGLNPGDRGAIAALVGTISAMNGLSLNVDYKTTNTFAVPYDSTGLAYTSGGTFTPVTYSTIGNAKTFSGLDGSAVEIETSNFASTGKEFLLGLYDGGMITIDLDIDNADAGQLASRAALQASAIKAIKIILPAGSTPNIAFNAFVKKFTMQSGVDKAISGQITLRISGGYTLS